jgi:hypothetical protein
MASHDHAHGHAHDHHGHTVAPGADQRPAFVGLIVGGLALGAILYGTVLLTNRQFAGHATPAKPAAAAGAPAAPAAH